MSKQQELSARIEAVVELVKETMGRQPEVGPWKIDLRDSSFGVFGSGDDRSMNELCRMALVRLNNIDGGLPGDYSAGPGMDLSAHDGVFPGDYGSITARGIDSILVRDRVLEASLGGPDEKVYAVVSRRGEWDKWFAADKEMLAASQSYFTCGLTSSEAAAQVAEKALGLLKRYRTDLSSELISVVSDETLVHVNGRLFLHCPVLRMKEGRDAIAYIGVNADVDPVVLYSFNGNVLLPFVKFLGRGILGITDKSYDAYLD